MKQVVKTSSALVLSLGLQACASLPRVAAPSYVRGNLETTPEACLPEGDVSPSFYDLIRCEDQLEMQRQECFREGGIFRDGPEPLCVYPLVRMRF